MSCSDSATTAVRSLTSNRSLGESPPLLEPEIAGDSTARLAFNLTDGRVRVKQQLVGRRYKRELYVELLNEIIEGGEGDEQWRRAIGHT